MFGSNVTPKLLDDVDGMWYEVGCVIGGMVLVENGLRCLTGEKTPRRTYRYPYEAPSYRHHIVQWWLDTTRET
jgi:hypothetical protein